MAKSDGEEVEVSGELIDEFEPPPLGPHGWVLYSDPASLWALMRNRGFGSTEVHWRALAKQGGGCARTWR